MDVVQLIKDSAKPGGINLFDIQILCPVENEHLTYSYLGFELNHPFCK